MDTIALVFWVIVFVGVPIAALVLARRQRMQPRDELPQEHPNPHPAHHRRLHEPHRPHHGA